MAIVNTVLTLQDLPAPPEGKTGWPWTEQSEPLPDRMPDDSKYPRISIITPSYNQGQFIEETIRSVLLQGYPNIEYIIIDGGSNDNTVEIINKYEKHITYWVSEQDEGQTHAINKGFAIATGDLIGWQNSDDFYYVNAFNSLVNASFNHFEYDVFYGTRNYLNLDGDGITTKDDNKSPFDLERMIPNANMANQSMFFRKRIFQHGNFLDTSFHHCMDHEFFWRLIFKGYRFIFVPEIKGCYRLHPDCKGRQLNNDYITDTVRICRSVYNNNELPYLVRRQAWSFLRFVCLNNYGQLKLAEFRQSLYDLINLGGIISIDVELVVKYIVSFVGETQLGNIRKLKSFVK